MKCAYKYRFTQHQSWLNFYLWRLAVHVLSITHPPVAHRCIRIYTFTALKKRQNSPDWVTLPASSCNRRQDSNKQILLTSSSDEPHILPSKVNGTSRQLTNALKYRGSRYARLLSTKVVMALNYYPMKLRLLPASGKTSFCMRLTAERHVRHWKHSLERMSGLPGLTGLQATQA